MTKQTEVFESWLPCFSGFYNTIWDNSENITYSVLEDCSEYDYLNKLLTKANIKDYEDFVNSTLWDNLNDKARENDIVTQICDIVGSELKELKIIDSMNFQSISSPKEYNFTNDSGNIEIQLTAENIKNIHKYIKDNYNEFFQFVKNNYTSYDGFWSHHSVYASDWLDKNNEEYFLNGNHKLGAILEFILNNEYEDYENNLYYDVEIYDTEYINYEGMIEDYKKEGVK